MFNYLPFQKMISCQALQGYSNNQLLYFFGFSGILYRESVEHGHFVYLTSSLTRKRKAKSAISCRIPR